MSVEKIMQKKLALDRNIHQVTRTEIKESATQQNDLNISDLVVSLSPFGFIFSWIIFFLILRKIRSALDEKMVFAVNDLHKLPCKNCQFYSNNHYLKCAVQPSIVLTEEAKNCTEYSPKKENLPNKKFFG